MPKALVPSFSSLAAAMAMVGAIVGGILWLEDRFVLAGSYEEDRAQAARERQELNQGILWIQLLQLQHRIDSLTAKAKENPHMGLDAEITALKAQEQRVQHRLQQPVNN